MNKESEQQMRIRIIANIRTLYRVSEEDAVTVAELAGALEQSLRELPLYIIIPTLITAQAGAYAANEACDPDDILQLRNLMVGFYRQIFVDDNKNLAG